MDGAGNPGGGKTSNASSGSSGTGGLLIIYSDTLKNNATISANGTAGGNGFRAGGGGSGGGSINIFFKTECIKGTIVANGGTRGVGTRGSECAHGGYGGTGTVSVGNISTGTYVGI